MTKYIKTEYQKDTIKMHVNENISCSEFEIEVVNEIAKAIDGEKIKKIEIEIIRN